MSNGMIALFFALGATGFSYNLIVRNNGNDDPRLNFIYAAVILALVFIFIFTFLEYVINF